MYVVIYLSPVPTADQPAKNIVLGVPSTFNLQSDTKFVPMSPRANEGG